VDRLILSRIYSKVSKVVHAEKTHRYITATRPDLFQPLFEVTQDPSSHPELHVFLQRVVGFDSVDDESKPERRLYRKFPTAKAWNTAQAPPYSYWLYYMFANMSSLNAWRRSRGFSEYSVEFR
jgi:AMP deaminase